MPAYSRILPEIFFRFSCPNYVSCSSISLPYSISYCDARILNYNCINHKRILHSFFLSSFSVSAPFPTLFPCSHPCSMERISNALKSSLGIKKNEEKDFLVTKEQIQKEAGFGGKTMYVSDMKKSNASKSFWSSHYT